MHQARGPTALLAMPVLLKVQEVEHLTLYHTSVKKGRNSCSHLQSYSMPRLGIILFNSHHDLWDTRVQYLCLTTSYAAYSISGSERQVPSFDSGPPKEGHGGWIEPNR